MDQGLAVSVIFVGLALRSPDPAKIIQICAADDLKRRGPDEGYPGLWQEPEQHPSAPLGRCYINIRALIVRGL